MLFLHRFRVRAALRQELGRAGTVLLGDQHDDAQVKALAIECLSAMRATGPSSGGS